jgi:hypothetical protein
MCVLPSAASLESGAYSALYERRRTTTTSAVRIRGVRIGERRDVVHVRRDFGVRAHAPREREVREGIEARRHRKAVPELVRPGGQILDHREIVARADAHRADHVALLPEGARGHVRRHAVRHERRGLRDCGGGRVSAMFESDVGCDRGGTFFEIGAACPPMAPRDGTRRPLGDRGRIGGVAELFGVLRSTSAIWMMPS